MLRSIMAPDLWGDFAAFGANLADWELEVSRYVRRADKDIGDETRIAVVLARCPPEFAAVLQNSLAGLKTYDVIISCIDCLLQAGRGRTSAELYIYFTRGKSTGKVKGKHKSNMDG